MTDQHKPQDACDDMTCKNDLMSGLMSLFAQAEAEEAQQKEQSSDVDDWLSITCIAWND